MNNQVAWTEQGCPFTILNRNVLTEQHFIDEYGDWYKFIYRVVHHKFGDGHDEDLGPLYDTLVDVQWDPEYLRNYLSETYDELCSCQVNAILELYNTPVENDTICEFYTIFHDNEFGYLLTSPVFEPLRTREGVQLSANSQFCTIPNGIIR